MIQLLADLQSCYHHREVINHWREATKDRTESLKRTTVNVSTASRQKLLLKSKNLKQLKHSHTVRSRTTRLNCLALNLTIESVTISICRQKCQNIHKIQDPVGGIKSEKTRGWIHGWLDIQHHLGGEENLQNNQKLLR